MTPLNDRLDEVGWNDKGDWREHLTLVFRWMQQATNEIDRLQDQVERLQDQVETRMGG